MRVLLVGIGEFYHLGALFERGLKELGHDYLFLDERNYADGGIIDKLAYHFLDKKPARYRSFNHDLVELAAKFQPDVLLAAKGGCISPDALSEVKRVTKAILVNYATDDPFNRGTSGRHIGRAIRHYDIYICTKRAIIDDVRKAGCPKVVFLPFAYEPSIHFPESPLSDDEKTRYRSDVAFIGGADRDRFPFFEALVDAIPNLSLHLYGGYWDRHPRLRSYHRGSAFGRDYRLVMASTKIAPCLVRRANRDGHVMRTFEVPACGAFLLAERTAEHAELFCESEEMACFSTPDELVEKTRYYLSHESERTRIASLGRAKVLQGSNSYKDRLKQILECARRVAESPDKQFASGIGA